MTDWAYDFTCAHLLKSLRPSLERRGQWRWQLRETAVYGPYLSCLPAPHARIRIHAYPFAGPYGAFTGLWRSGFKALLQVDLLQPERAEIDRNFRELLNAIGATNVTAIEPYD